MPATQLSGLELLRESRPVSSRGASLLAAHNGVFLVHSRTDHWVVPPGAVLYLADNTGFRISRADAVNIIQLSLAPELAARLSRGSGLYVSSSLMRELLESLSVVGEIDEQDSRGSLLVDLLAQTAPPVRRPVPLFLDEPKDARLVRICEYVRAHLDTPRTLQDWADELGNNPRTLHRLFLREFGMSFVQWRQQARLMAALEWLAIGRPVMDVALDLGYQTQSAFSAMFRRHMGITPSMWRGAGRRLLQADH